VGTEASKEMSKEMQTGFVHGLLPLNISTATSEVTVCK